jgi:predicted acyltransferase
MSKAVRFQALDALRGLAIALMILVNTPGSWSEVYSALLHAPWHGFTFADLVFPGFLFVVGAAMFFALKQATLDRSWLLKIGKRTLLMFLCGLFLNWFWMHELASLRVMGVLQRIALCYGLAALIILGLGALGQQSDPEQRQRRIRRQLPFLAMLLLFGYWGLLQLSPDPYSLEHNVVRQLDLLLFGSAHLYQGFGIPFDPEGLLSTLPAIVNVLLGYWIAAELSQRKPAAGVRWLWATGVVLVVLALGGSLVWPINKALWTGTYVLFSGGLLVWLLALMVWLIDIRGATRLAEPLRIYGTNPLFIYMLSWVWAVVLSKLLLWQQDGQLMSAYQYGFELLALGMPAKLASLVFALAHVVLFWALSYWLYRKQIFIKL